MPGAALVDREYRSIQWKGNNHKEPRDDDIIRYLPRMMGSCQPREFHWRDLGEREKSLHINVLQLKAVDLAIRTFTKNNPVKATSIATNAFQQFNWSQMFPYAFPPFGLVGKTLKKVTLHCIDMIIITPVWVSQTWFPLLLYHKFLVAKIQ